MPIMPEAHRDKKKVWTSSYGVPGYKPRNIWTPSAYKNNAHTHCRVHDIVYLYTRRLVLPNACLRTEANHHWCGLYPNKKFPRLVFWNTTMIVWCCYWLICSVTYFFCFLLLIIIYCYDGSCYHLRQHFRCKYKFIFSFSEIFSGKAFQPLPVPFL